jgi:hypothetical protein
MNEHLMNTYWLVKHSVECFSWIILFLVQ